MVFKPFTLLLALIALLKKGTAVPSPIVPNVALFNLSATVTPPSGNNLKFVYQGYGTQNYTCNATSLTFETSGTAVAKLLDVTPYFTGASVPTTLPAIQDLFVAGTHFYVPDPLNVTTIVPQFLTYNGQFFIGTKNVTVASAIPTYSVASVLLKNVDFQGQGGSLASWVVRTDVVGGVTPTVLNTCTPGQGIAVPYEAHYLFFSP